MEAKNVLLEELETLKALNRDRFDYVLARAHCKSVTAALLEIEKTDGWYYRFTQDERDLLEKLATELHYAQRIQSELMLEQTVVEAAQVKIDGLRSKKDVIRQDVATEILDRVHGKPKQRQEVSGPNGGPIETRTVIYIPDNGRGDGGSD